MGFKYQTAIVVFMLSLYFCLHVETKPRVNVNVNVGVNGKEVINEQYPKHLNASTRGK